MVEKSVALFGLLLLAGCAGAIPTPQIIYVTAPPQTPTVIYVTPDPGPSAAAGAISPGADAITGTLAIHASANVWTGSHACSQGNFNDGAGVVVRDATDRIIGTGTLGAGIADGDPPKPSRTYSPIGGPPPPVSGANSSVCRFQWTASAPRSDFYVIAIAGGAPYAISYADLAAKGWKLDLTVGP